MRDDLAAIWIGFADTAGRGYSRLYDRVCRAVAASDAMGDLLDEAPPQGHQPMVLLAAVHYLLLGGLEHPLADVYAGRSDADPAPLFIDVCLTHHAEILDLLATRHTNTNEVGRCAVIAPALTTVAARLGTPLAHVDVGCSAGLNLRCDRYRIDYGAAGATGQEDAPVRIDCRVVGGVPPIAPELPAIRARVGIDRDPVDLADQDAVRWLLACTWPDTGRLPRTRAALEAARRDPPEIVAGDAVATVGGVLRALPPDAVAVVTTTWALAYLSEEQRDEFHRTLVAVSRDRPVAWVSAEAPNVVGALGPVETRSDDQGMEASVLGLVTFHDGDADAEVLAFVHPHGSWIDWRA